MQCAKEEKYQQIKKYEMLKIEFVGKNDFVLKIIEIPKNCVCFDVSLNCLAQGELKETYKCVADNEIMGTISSELLSQVCYLRGFSDIENLTQFYFTSYPPTENCLRLFDYWPDSENIVRRIEYISMPITIAPARLKNMHQRYTYRDAYCCAITSLFGHNKILDTCMAFSMLDISPYVILWILSFCVPTLAEKKIIDCIFTILDSIKRRRIKE